jgi:hypothetical protein
VARSDALVEPHHSQGLKRNSFRSGGTAKRHSDTRPVTALCRYFSVGVKLWLFRWMEDFHWVAAEALAGWRRVARMVELRWVLTGGR